MTLPPGWLAPVTWTDIERHVFAALQSGRAFDMRTDAEKQQASTGSMVVERNRPVTISGTFLSEITRKYTDEFPIGVQLLGVAIDGEVALESVRVEKILSLEQCYFTGPIIARGTKFLWVSLTGSVVEGYVDMRSAIISGAVFLRSGFRSLTSTLLRDITVTGPIDCTGAVFKYDSLGRIGEFTGAAEGESFSLARGIASALFWKDMREPPTGYVNLRNVQIKSLRDGKDEVHPKSVGPIWRDWPATGKLRMSGLKYEERTLTEAAPLRAWIELQDSKESRYGSYQTAIKVLSDSGQELSANELTLEKQRYIAKNEQSWLTKRLRYIFIGLSDAGLGTDKIARITGAAFLVSLVAIFYAAHEGGFVPKNNEILKNACFKISNPCTDPSWKEFPDKQNAKFRVPDYHPEFNSIGYTIDQFVPGVNYGVAADWRPQSDGLTALTVAIRVIGSVLFGLLVVCVSGITRISK